MNAVVITLKQTVKHWSMTSHHRMEKTVCLLMNIPNRPNNGMLHFSLLLSSHIWHVGQNVAGIRNYCTVSSVAKQCMCIKNNYLAINFIWRNHQLGMAKPQLISISTISYLKRKLITKLKKCTAKYGQDNFTRISSFSFPFSTAVPLSNVTVLTDNMAKKQCQLLFSTHLLMRLSKWQIQSSDVITVCLHDFSRHLSSQSHRGPGHPDENTCGLWA